MQTTVTREQAIAAVREHGSCDAAARALGVSWPTIARRLGRW
jgi:DNA-binding transcriptional LysR family regulator